MSTQRLLRRNNGWRHHNPWPKLSCRDKIINMTQGWQPDRQDQNIDNKTITIWFFLMEMSKSCSRGTNLFNKYKTKVDTYLQKNEIRSIFFILNKDQPKQHAVHELADPPSIMARDSNTLASLALTHQVLYAQFKPLPTLLGRTLGVCS